MLEKINVSQHVLPLSILPVIKGEKNEVKSILIESVYWLL